MWHCCNVHTGRFSYYSFLGCWLSTSTMHKQFSIKSFESHKGLWSEWWVKSSPFLVKFIKSLVNSGFVNVILSASHATFILQSKLVLVTQIKMEIVGWVLSISIVDWSAAHFEGNMGDQDKSGGSVSLTAPVEDVMKRICSNSKVSFTQQYKWMMNATKVWNCQSIAQSSLGAILI